MLVVGDELEKVTFDPRKTEIPEVIEPKFSTTDSVVQVNWLARFGEDRIVDRVSAIGHKLDFSQFLVFIAHAYTTPRRRYPYNYLYNNWRSLLYKHISLVISSIMFHLSGRNFSKVDRYLQIRG